MPGRINTARGVAHTGGIFTFIRDAPMARLLADCLHAPVTIANDGKCAVRAEAWNGALADVENGAVLVLGTGTGGGLLLGRRVWMGSSYAAGELSVLGMDFARMARACTDVTVLSRGHAVERLDVCQGGCWSHYTSRRGLPEGSVDGYAFFDAYEAGEPEAAETLRTFGEMAAAGIYSLQAVLDLQRIAIGGGISARPEVTRVIREGGDAAVCGGALHPHAGAGDRDLPLRQRRQPAGRAAVPIWNTGASDRERGTASQTSNIRRAVPDSGTALRLILAVKRIRLCTKC